MVSSPWRFLGLGSCWCPLRAGGTLMSLGLHPRGLSPLCSFPRTFSSLTETHAKLSSLARNSWFPQHRFIAGLPHPCPGNWEPTVVPPWKLRETERCGNNMDCHQGKSPLRSLCLLWDKPPVLVWGVASPCFDDCSLMLPASVHSGRNQCLSALYEMQIAKSFTFPLWLV